MKESGLVQYNCTVKLDYIICESRAIDDWSAVQIFLLFFGIGA